MNHTGSIPACAGEPRRPRPEARRSRVYPRVCGGAPVECDRDFAAVSGSIPACAGEPHISCRAATRSIPACAGEPQAARWVEAAYRRRSIPACAGEPGGDVLTRRRRRVYPRVCGGARAMSLPRSCWTGLSPRVRGSPVSGREHAGRRGSIPACAGEPRHLVEATASTSRSIPACAGEPSQRECASGGVYPRVCGGAGAIRSGGKGLSPRVRGSPVELHGASQPLAGLSPRVRGSLRHQCRARGREGSIPACAGEPCKIGDQAPNSTGSIPACAGEPSGTPPERRPRIGGSIPACAGEPPWLAASLARTRSIPACAGEPRARGVGGELTTVVYPRVCGGAGRRLHPARRTRQVYPRVCGGAAALGRSVATLTGGSIPACAGEPAALVIPACAGEPGSRIVAVQLPT